jgi:hypothetical protein
MLPQEQHKNVAPRRVAGGVLMLLPTSPPPLVTLLNNTNPSAPTMEGGIAEGSILSMVGGIAEGSILSMLVAVSTLVMATNQVGVLLFNPAKGKNSHQEEVNKAFKQFLVKQPMFLQCYVIAFNYSKNNRLLLKKATAQIAASWLASRNNEGSYFLDHDMEKDNFVVSHNLFPDKCFHHGRENRIDIPVSHVHCFLLYTTFLQEWSEVCFNILFVKRNMVFCGQVPGQGNDNN